MSHFINIYTNEKTGKVEYQYPRRATKVLYESRTTRGPDRGQARVFNTKSAAKNSSISPKRNESLRIEEVALTPLNHNP